MGNFQLADFSDLSRLPLVMKEQLSHLVLSTNKTGMEQNLLKQADSIKGTVSQKQKQKKTIDDEGLLNNRTDHICSRKEHGTIRQNKQSCMNYTKRGRHHPNIMKPQNRKLLASQFKCWDTLLFLVNATGNK